MMTWVLIVFVAVGYSGVSVVIPGYSSKAECEAAGEVAKKTLPIRASTWPYCIPVPSQRGGQG